MPEVPHWQLRLLGVVAFLALAVMLVVSAWYITKRATYVNSRAIPIPRLEH